MADRVRVARIGTAHGIRGEVRLWSFTADPLAVATYGPLETKDGARRFTIEAARPGKEFLVVRIAGISDRNAAEKLRNTDLFVPRDRLPTIEEADTFYHADLVGLRSPVICLAAAGSPAARAWSARSWRRAMNSSGSSWYSSAAASVTRSVT